VGVVGSAVRIDRRSDMAEVALPDDEPRPQRHQVVEGRGGAAGACAPLDPVAQADVVAAPDADRVGLALAPDNVSVPPHDLAFTRRQTTRARYPITPTSVASGAAISPLTPARRPFPFCPAHFL
jgi:hypothetical protein